MGIKEKMTDLLSLPKEIALDMPVLLATGNDELDIENYKSLLEFNANEIRVLTRAGVLVVDGEGLILKQVTSENILITGKISGTRWL